MISNACRNIQIHLSRNDGQTANTLTQVIAAVAHVGFQIRSARLHEQRGHDGHVMLRAWFKGATRDEVGAIGSLLAALGQESPHFTM